MPEAPVREVIRWEELGEAAQVLAEQVRESGFAPDIVLAIARGGLLPGGALGYALGIKNTFSISVEFYTGVDERLPMPLVLPPVPVLNDLADKKVLIVDDVADTGLTLQVVEDFCRGDVAETRIACLYEKPRSVVKCDYAWRRTDHWITFPWSGDD